MIDAWQLARPLPDGIGTVSQWFGEHPINYVCFGLAGHNGIDYAAPINSPVLAAHAGTCAIGDDPAGFGLFVTVQDDRKRTVYAHLQSIAVQAGQLVQAGTQLGSVGSTGNSTGPHLHFGLKWLRGNNPAYLGAVDPLPFRE